MRLIGHLNQEANARAFGDYLVTQGIENQLEAEQGGVWGVWIHAEEELGRAKQLLGEYQGNPTDPKYQGAAQKARELQEAKRRDQVAYEKRQKSRRHLFRPLTAYGFGPLTFLMICASVVVFVFSKVGPHQNIVESLWLSAYDLKGIVGVHFWTAAAMRLREFGSLLPEVRHGEIWRLITPIFMHADFLHIFFNMLWLRDLGSMIEGRQSTWLLAVQVLVFAVISNVAQFIVSGPLFLGMSGVVYGLMGYIWIRGKLDPGSGLYLHPSTVVGMIIWFLVGMTGVLGVANTCHGAGLASGMAWGYLSSLRHR